MVYISSDGSVSRHAPPSRVKSIMHSVLNLSPGTAIGIAIAVISLTRLVDFGPLANGRIPARARGPEDHWSYMKRNSAFVRTMTEGLKTKAATKEGKKRLQQSQTFSFMERVDFGGADGHVAEGGEMDLENIRVTRCSTTRSGITAYFCGKDVATNQDAALGYKGKVPNFGVESFRQYLTCRHRDGHGTGTHKRSVYRLGVGCKDNLAGYSHAFSIVAQPDGTYFWLQSYISQYSLATWMSKADGTKESGLAAHLTYDELMEKLDAVDRLMSIDSWTPDANADYNDLFNVDKDLEAAKGSTRRKINQWNMDHRLHVFSWDEACEYPLPEGYLPAEKNASDDPNSSGAEEDGKPARDKCDVLLARTSLSQLFGVPNLFEMEKDL